MMWEKIRESRVWLSSCSRRRFIFKDHDALFIAAGRLRIRLMKPRGHVKWI